MLELEFFVVSLRVLPTRAAMCNDEGAGKKTGEESETAGLSAKALEELEERLLVKKILSRVSSDDPGEGSSKQTEKGE